MIHVMDGAQPESSIPAIGAEQATTVERHLRRSPYLSLRSIKCSHYQGKLLLSGQVPTFYLTQLAQSLAHSVGEMEVLNCVEVARPGNLLSRRLC